MVLRWMPQNIAYDKSTLVQVMANTCVHVDPDQCNHMASQGHNKLTIKFMWIVFSNNKNVFDIF